MAEYPGAERERRIAAPVLREAVSTVFERCGMSAADASVLAESLVHADLRGVHSHGVMRVPEYVDKLTTGGVNPRGRPFVTRDNGNALVVDGANSMGQIGGSFAMREAIRRAEDANIAVAAVRGSNHCGAMAWFATMVLPADMIGFAATNALPTMAPWGGRDKIVGINPVAIVIPAGTEHPLVLDAAFSYSSHGKIRVYHQKGFPIPPQWAFDEDGNPTTDTAKALQGLLQPIGEYKGAGLAILAGVLSSLLSGAAYGTELGNMIDGPAPGRDGHIFAALRIAAFVEVEEFKSRVDGVIRQIRESRRAEGVERLWAPGGLEAETEAQNRRDGIPLNEETIGGFEGAAARVGARVAL